MLRIVEPRAGKTTVFPEKARGARHRAGLPSTLVYGADDMTSKVSHTACQKTSQIPRPTSAQERVIAAEPQGRALAAEPVGERRQVRPGHVLRAGRP